MNCGQFGQQENCVDSPTNLTGCAWKDGKCVCDENIAHVQDGKCVHKGISGTVTTKCSEYDRAPMMCQQVSACKYDDETDQCLCRNQDGHDCIFCPTNMSPSAGMCTCAEGTGYSAEFIQCFPCGYGNFRPKTPGETDLIECKKCETYTNTKRTRCYNSCDGDHVRADSI